MKLRKRSKTKLGQLPECWRSGVKPTRVVDEGRRFRKLLPMRPGLRLVVAASEVQAVGGGRRFDHQLRRFSLLCRARIREGMVEALEDGWIEAITAVDRNDSR